MKPYPLIPGTFKNFANKNFIVLDIMLFNPPPPAGGIPLSKGEGVRVRAVSSFTLHKGGESKPRPITPPGAVAAATGGFYEPHIYCESLIYCFS
jgi:hypothetical protein